MELWDAYDQFENKLDITLVRGEKIPTGVFHLVCETVVQHQDGTFLLMQRDYQKKGWPGYWEIGASGSALRNETGLEAAKRELFEETGICTNSMQEIFHFSNIKEQSIYYGYLTVTNQPKDHITFQEGETIAYKWLSKKAIIELLESDNCITTQRERLLPIFKTNFEKNSCL